VLVITRHIVPSPEAGDFVDQAERALAALSRCAGFAAGRVARAADDPRHWVVVTEWLSVGAYRRALGRYEVKIQAVPLLSTAIDEPTAYENLLLASANSPTVRVASDLASD
jgi:heme oxygenase (mycobilin-producing)